MVRRPKTHLAYLRMDVFHAGLSKTAASGGQQDTRPVQSQAHGMDTISVRSLARTSFRLSSLSRTTKNSPSKRPSDSPRRMSVPAASGPQSAIPRHPPRTMLPSRTRRCSPKIRRGAPPANRTNDAKTTFFFLFTMSMNQISDNRSRMPDPQAGRRLLITDL